MKIITRSIVLEDIEFSTGLIHVAVKLKSHLIFTLSKDLKLFDHMIFITW